MRLRDFRIGWRLLLQDPASSLATILGLAAGFTVFFCSLALLYYTHSFDRQVPDAQRVYIVKSSPNWQGSKWRENVPLRAAEALQRSGLPLQTSRIMLIDGEMRGRDLVQQVDLAAVDANFPAMFGVRVLAGDVNEAVTRPDAIALTVASARRLFGDTDVVGKSVAIRGDAYRVTALLADAPDNTTVGYAALAAIDSNAWSAKSRTATLEDWSNLDGRLYVKLGPGTTPEAVARALEQTLENSPLRSQLKPDESAEVGTRKLFDVALGPLTESYLDQVQRSGNSSKKGNPTVLTALAVVSLFILLLATVNHVNLSTVRIINRQREIAVRKVLGASGNRVIAQMIAEAVLVSTLAAVIGALLAGLLLPGVAHFTSLDLTSLLTPRNMVSGLAACLAFGVAVGVLAGLYPAWMTLKMRPAQILGGRGNTEGKHGFWLRRSLTVLQFALGMCLASVAMTMTWQVLRINNMNFGFDPNPLLSIVLPANMEKPEAQSFRDAVARLPGVAHVAAASETVGQASLYDVEVKAADGRAFRMGSTPVSPDYFAAYGVGPVAGRLFDAGIDPRENASVVVIDELAARTLGFASPAAAVGQIVAVDGKPLRIVGVNRALLTQSINRDVRPRLFQLSLATPTLTVRVQGDPAPVASEIEKLWGQHFPNNILMINPVRRMLEIKAREITPFLRLVSFITVIAVLLAAFGMYVLSAHSMQRRSREIVLRKLYGARSGDIARLAGREFVTLIAVSALLGLPAGAAIGLSMLKGYADHGYVVPLALGTALLGGVLIALLSSLRHTLAAMRMSPAQALRG
jgi:putative ABC transport system permease protein